MNVLMGILIIAITVGLAFLCVGLLYERGSIALIGGVLTGGAITAMMIVVGIMLMIGPSETPIEIGKCYEAYPHTTTVKGVDYQGVTLVEKPC